MLASAYPIHTRRESSAVGPKVLLFAAAALVLLSVLVRPLSHDEGQYVAAIEFARHGLPYRDFAYLQTPLQPVLLSPLGGLTAGWLLFGVRVANGIFGTLTVVFLIMALRRRASNRSMLIALAALVCSEPFLLAASNARNDALPMALIAMTIFAFLRGLGGEQRARWLGSAGLLIGLASSTKISSAVLVAPLALFIVLRFRLVGWKPAIAFGAGVLAGLAPTAILAVLAPAQFRFDVFTYSLVAPRQWWSAVGREHSLVPSIRIARLLSLSAQGCVLVGMIAAALDRRRSDDRLLLDLLIIGGLVAAYLPEPAYPQYLVPLLPPVAARFALAFDTLTGKWRKPVIAIALVCGVAGLRPTGKDVARTIGSGDDLIAAISVGGDVANAAAGGSIVTLSPEMIAGSDTNLDVGFVTGPFLFRTSDSLGDEAQRLGYSPNWQRINTALDDRQPSVIVTGGERKPWPPGFPKGFDEPISEWAIAHNYKRSPFPGDVDIWQRTRVPK